MAEQDARDDLAIRHFVSRSQIPHVLPGGSRNQNVPASLTPVMVSIQFDGLRPAAEIDGSKYVYQGADSAAGISRYEQMKRKREGMYSMRHGFQ